MGMTDGAEVDNWACDCMIGSDKLREECGIFGVYGTPGAANLAYFGLYALQHRGQESAGIAVSNGKELLLHKGMGLVRDVFDEQNLSSLRGDIACGHVRYSTTGSSSLGNAQPLTAKYAKGTMAVAHNGNLVNADELRRELEGKGALFQSSTDSEVIANLIARLSRDGVEDAIAECMQKIKGAYSLVIMTENKLIGVRDPNGFRPLVIGKLGHSFVLASETCALDTVGASFVREVLPGEIVSIDERGISSSTPVQSRRQNFCIFEYVYFARPDSIMNGRCVHTVRKKFGEALAREHSTDVDLIVPVPDSGISAAIGLAEASGVPYGEGMIKNRYIGRTFIQPEQGLRDVSVRIKLNPIRDAIDGKKLIVIDDSIVRGTTSRRLVKMLRDGGAKEVHLRITCPPIANSCFYGIDTPTREELIASSHTVEEMRKKIGADSLGFLSLDGMVEATGIPKENFCLACFTGDYPISAPHQTKIHKFVLEKK